MSTHIQIERRFTGATLYTYVPTAKDCAAGRASRAAVEAAVAQRADLRDANLSDAYLNGANLSGAYLNGAYLRDNLKLVGKRPALMVGPLGSRADVLIGFVTDGGLYLRAGCWFGSRDDFAARVDDVHGQSAHGEEYRAALVLVEAHARLWSPI